MGSGAGFIEVMNTPNPQPVASAAPGASKRNRKLALTAGYYAMFAAFGLTFSVLGPTLPALAELTGSGLQAISFLFVARSAGSLIGSLLAGPLYDRLPEHAVMAAFLAFIALTLFLTPSSALLLALTAVTLLLGFAQGGLNVGGNALLVWVHGQDSAPYMSGLHFFFGAGSSIAPVIVAWSFQAGGLHWAYWALALLVLLPIPFLLKLPSPKLERETTGNHARDTAGQRARAEENSGSSKGTLLLAGLVSLFLFCYSGAANCFGGWIYTYALTLNLADATRAAYLTSTFWVALTIGRLIAIPLAMYIHPARLLWADLAGSLLSLALILGLPQAPWAIWVGSAGLGLSLASMFPITVSMAGRSMAVTGKMAGWFSAGSNLGALILPLLVGQFFEITGPQVLMIVLLADMLLAVAVLAVMLRSLRQMESHVPQANETLL